MVVIFAIIGKSEPLYEAEIVPAGPGEEELAYLHQFILHASLDMVQSAMWSNNATLVSTKMFSDSKWITIEKYDHTQISRC